MLARDTALTVLCGARELGVNHIDTAAFYRTPDRAANKLINTALRPYADDLVIATKVGPGHDPAGNWVPEVGPTQLRGQVEQNLRELGREQLDLVNLRVGAGLVPESGSLAERFGALAELRERGLVVNLGISNVTPAQLDEAQTIVPVVCVQNQYGLGNASDDALVDVCRERGIAFVPFFSLAESPLSERVAAVVANHGVRPAQVLLAWTLHRAPNVLAIPGTGDPAHLEQNVAAGGVRLSADELDHLAAGAPSAAG